MASRIRFLTLTLAGFGRYDRPTRFNLDGRSCSFTSPNELGKSTFHSGLLATLFGPPSIRAKVAAFQSRYRSWNGPIAFWGELDFAVSDEHFRVRRDFDSLEVKVWRLSKEGTPELRYEAKAKPGRQPTEDDPYSRLLEDWLGMSDRTLYEAMFTISQETTLAASWQIDPRIASLIYGPAVERLNHNLQELHDRFREITRNTREHQISVGSQGERNGRSDGKLDEAILRTTQLEANLAAAQERAQAITQHRSRLAELESHCDQLRTQLADTSHSLDNWRTWIELESRLRPAVESYERLRDLNERCQHVTRPLAQLRGRLAGDLAIFEHAPDDLAERLEYYPLHTQAVDEARQRHKEAVSQREQFVSPLADWKRTLETEFIQHRGRPLVADQIEELRLVREEIACVRTRLTELSLAAENPDREREAIRQRLGELVAWRRLGPDWESRVSETREKIEQFWREHAEYSAAWQVARDETHWMAEQDDRISRVDARVRVLRATRERERSEITAVAERARASIESARSKKSQIEAARSDIEGRYVDFAGAPTNLPELWDHLHAIEAEQADSRCGIDSIRDDVLKMDRRRYWRRGLTTIGAIVSVACLFAGRGWLGWLASAFAAGICVSVRWIYPKDASLLAETKRKGLRAEAEHLRLGRKRDECAGQVGPPFVVPLEREAEWRRLWPTYRRELEQLDNDIRTLPTDEQIAELIKTARDAEASLTRYGSETEELLAEAQDELDRARAERERRSNALDLLRDQLAAHVERYFVAGCEDWQTQPTETLPAWWEPILLLAEANESVRSNDASAADRHESDDRAPYPCRHLTTIQSVVDWCRGLDEAAWSQFADSCSKLQRLEAELAPDPAGVAAKEAAFREATELLKSLEEQEFLLVDATAPFTAETDVAWLRERFQACQQLESQIAERELVLEQLPTLESLVAEVDVAMTEHAEAAAVLTPLLERFENDPARIIAGLQERAELTGQIRELKKRAAELPAESGFASLEELAHEAGKAEGLVGTIRASSQELLAQANELWQAMDASPELPRQKARELESRQAELQATLDAAQRERAELVATIRHIESDPNNDTGTMQTELDLLHGERAELEKRRDQIADEFQEVNRLMQELQRVERAALEGRITAYFADFSRTAGRRVELDEELRIRLRNEDGVRYAPDQLSHGARDQLYLAVYLATTAGLDLPFVLDDPFVNCDAERLAAIRACWDRLIPDHQLILLSHDPRLASWASTLEMREAA